jgi:hypothetical protein
LIYNGYVWNEPVLLSSCDDVCNNGEENDGCTFFRMSLPGDADFNGRFRLFFARFYRRSCSSLAWRPSSTYWSDFQRDVGVSCNDDNPAQSYSMSYGGVLTCVNCESCFDGRHQIQFEAGIDCGGACQIGCQKSSIRPNKAYRELRYSSARRFTYYLCVTRPHSQHRAVPGSASVSLSGGVTVEDNAWVISARDQVVTFTHGLSQLGPSMSVTVVVDIALNLTTRQKDMTQYRCTCRRVLRRSFAHSHNDHANSPIVSGRDAYPLFYVGGAVDGVAQSCDDAGGCAPWNTDTRLRHNEWYRLVWVLEPATNRAEVWLDGAVCCAFDYYYSWVVVCTECGLSFSF